MATRAPRPARRTMREFDRAVPMMLQRALEVVQPMFREILARFSLTQTQWRVLRVLWETDDRSLADVSRRTLVPAPSLVGVIDRLEREGLVRRERARGDRRQIRIRLTAKGNRLHDEVLPLVEQVYEDLERMLPRAQWDALYAAIDALCAAGQARQAARGETKTTTGEAL